MTGSATSPIEALQRLEDVAARIDEVVLDLLAGDVLTRVGDDDLVRALTVAGRAHRRIEGVLIEAVDQAQTRSTAAAAEERLTDRYGCRNVGELVQRATLIAPQTAAKLTRAAKAIHRDTAMVSGEPLPAALPALREAMIEGHVATDGLLAAASPLASLARRCDDRPALLAADAALADAARGDGPDGAPPACADLLRVQATAWAAVLDPDGSEPRDRLAVWKRSLTLGQAADGLVPLHARLLPEVAAQLQRIIDALCAPRGEGDTGGVRFVPSEPAVGDEAYTDRNSPLDDRRPAQRRHDALATALFAAAASSTLPTIGGAAPTVVVSVRESDLAEGRGFGHADGTDEPIAIRAVTALACGGVMQRVVLADDGRIVRIGVEDRVFDRHQRRAIALRDGGCIIPGCTVPAAWCEIHHVVEHADGGPTHTHNGVLICWFHHRHLHLIGWLIRMNRGVPEVKAPTWNDASGTWRRVTKSPNRLKDLIVRRT